MELEDIDLELMADIREEFIKHVEYPSEEYYGVSLDITRIEIPLKHTFTYAQKQAYCEIIDLMCQREGIIEWETLKGVYQCMLGFIRAYAKDEGKAFRYFVRKYFSNKQPCK